MGFHGQTFLITFTAALGSLADAPEKKKSPLDVGPKQGAGLRLARDNWAAVWVCGNVCSGTLAKAAGVVLGWGMQRDRMNRAGGVVVIRNSAGARGCLESPGGWSGGGENQATASSLVPSPKSPLPSNLLLHWP